MALAPSQSVQDPGGTLTYSGNPDFRGFIAANDPQYLSYVGNDVTGSGTTGINTAAMTPLNSSTINNDVSAIDALYNQYAGIVNGGSGGGGSGSSSSSTANPGAAALYNNLANEYEQEEQTLEGETPTLKNNIANAYNTSVSEQNQNMGNEQNQNMQQRQSTNGTIDQNANSTYNSLMALLGAAGAAGSSASIYGVPQAVGNQTNSQTNNMNSTFNENENTIQESNQNALADLLSQENTNMANALSGLSSQEQEDVQNSQSAEANAAYYGGKPNATLDTSLNTQGSNIQNQLSQIFSQYATPSYTAPAAPSLASYNTPTAATATGPTTASPSTPTAASAFLPFLTQSAQGQNLLTGNNTTPANASAGAT